VAPARGAAGEAALADLLDGPHAPFEQLRRGDTRHHDARRPALVEGGHERAHVGGALERGRDPNRQADADLEHLVARERRKERPPGRPAVEHARERRPDPRQAVAVGGGEPRAAVLGHVLLEPAQLPRQGNRAHEPSARVIGPVEVHRHHSQRVGDGVDGADV
jgi:hypothetical protein